MLLTAETVTLLMMQPAQLLENFGMIWVSVKHTTICALSIVVLETISWDHSEVGFGHIHLSAAREHVQFGTRYLLR